MKKESSRMSTYKILLIIIVFCGFSGVGLARENAYSDTTKFSHKQHVIEEELECADCHSNVENSISGLDNLMPEREVCLDCHEEDELKNFQSFAPITRFSEKFSHKKHLTSGEDCQSCHGAVVEPTAAPADIIPGMTKCMDCHESKIVSVTANTCRTCHTASENLKPLSHTFNFEHNHSDQARMAAGEMSTNKNCMVCHKQNFCQDCHEGDNLARFSHPLNYEFTHALSAQNKERDCAVCHTERSFCVSCHRDNNVLPRSHTVGWVNQIPNDGGRHSVEAEVDLESCIACHEQDAQAICQPCHAN